MKLLVFAIIALGFPALELAGIYQIWQQIGAWTLLWLAVSVVLGVAVLRVEQAEFLPRLMYSAFEGRTPFAVLFESGRRMLAGVLLIFPGAITDAIALLLLLWPAPSRPAGARRGPGAHGPRAANDDVIEGEWRRED